MFVHAKANFEKKDVSFEEWGAKKASGKAGEMPGMPIVYEGDQMFQQTSAIMRMYGMKFGYYPKDYMEAGIVDMIFYSFADVFNAIGALITDTESSDEEKAAKAAEIRDGVLTKFFNVLKTQLEKNVANKYLVGTGMTIADFAVAALLFNLVTNDACPFSPALSPIMLSFPDVGAYQKRLHAALKDYLDSRPPSPF